MSKKFNKYAAQGDVLIVRVESIPEGVALCPRDKNNAIIVTHSETGHHHVIERKRVSMYQDPKDPLTAWLEVHGEEGLPNVAELIHKRSHHTHETLEIPTGKYMIRRQRQYTPKGWERVVD